MLAFAVLFHFPSGEGVSFAYTAALIVTAAALSWHICTGVKSLTRDLGISNMWRTIIRVVACAAAVAIAVALIL